MNGQWDRRFSRGERQSGGSGLGSWLGLASGMMLLPFRMLGWGMQLMAQTGEGMQSLADGGTGVRGSRAGAPAWLPPPVQPPAWPAPPYAPQPPAAPTQFQSQGIGTGSAARPAGAVANLAETTNREEKDMACDKDLSGTDLKVVEYSIVSVSPNIQNDNQRLIFSDTIATSEDMTDADFASWVIAMYIQRHPDRILHDEKQYLRVCHCVQCRLSIPDVNYQKKQADALDRINRTLERRLPRDTEESEGGNLPAKTR